jgi:hypothetical protein
VGSTRLLVVLGKRMVEDNVPSNLSFYF